MTGPAGINLEAVTAWLAGNVGVKPPLEFTRLPGGHSNLTYRVDDAAGRAVVLRRPPLGELLPTAHDMGREFAFISALHDTDVPVPAPLGHCTDPEVTGAPFYVMGFVEGAVLHHVGIAESFLSDEAARRRCGESFVDALVALHAADPDEVGVGHIGRKEGYVARQLKRWYGQWDAQKTRDLPAVDDVHDALVASIPEQGPARIVHGDFRLGNCITQDSGRIAAVLDWEIATLGDPLADLGYVLTHWGEPGEQGMLNAVSPSALSGFPARADVVDRYARRSGRDVSRIGFYVAFSFWKSACIVEGVVARYLAGALDTTGVDVDGLRSSVDYSISRAAEALGRL